ncbi:MAG: iron-containing alcohol dehydrogenase family protein [Lachnospiraceae bacterium]|nr:iron-containing alcohol dehydrogenase family protein [Lachnospiraceae bacterium]
MEQQGKEGENMFFYLPTKIYSERDCVKKYANEWTKCGRNALIVTGRSSAKCGALADVTEALEKENIPYSIFNQIEENPSVELIMEVRKLGLEQQADFVIGIGGGSPMDAAKAISLMIAHKEEGADFLYRKGSDSALPLVEVPTTCGTGSEATPYSILTVHEKRTKASISHKIFPVFALVDGKYLKGAPRSLLVNTAVDALGHFVESYINVNATDYSRMLCEYGMGVWSSCKNVLIGAEIRENDFDRMMNASTIAGMAISHTGTALPHGLSYYLTYEKGIPHGKAVGYFLPGYLAEAGTIMGRRVLGLTGFPDMQYFRSFMHRLIGRMEVEDELIGQAVQGLMENEAKLRNTPYPVTEEVLYRICKAAR